MAAGYSDSLPARTRIRARVALCIPPSESSPNPAAPAPPDRACDDLSRYVGRPGLGPVRVQPAH